MCSGTYLSDMTSKTTGGKKLKDKFNNSQLSDWKILQPPDYLPLDPAIEFKIQIIFIPFYLLNVNCLPRKTEISLNQKANNSAQFSLGIISSTCWSRKWQPTPVFSPEECHGQKSLAGYSPEGRKESDRTEHAHTLTLLFARLVQGFGDERVMYKWKK